MVLLLKLVQLPVCGWYVLLLWQSAFHGDVIQSRQYTVSESRISGAWSLYLGGAKYLKEKRKITEVKNLRE